MQWRTRVGLAMAAGMLSAGQSEARLEKVLPIALGAISAARGAYMAVRGLGLAARLASASARAGAGIKRVARVVTNPARSGQRLGRKLGGKLAGETGARIGGKIGNIAGYAASADGGMLGRKAGAFIGRKAASMLGASGKASAKATSVGSRVGEVAGSIVMPDFASIGVRYGGKLGRALGGSKGRATGAKWGARAGAVATTGAVMSGGGLLGRAMKDGDKKDGRAGRDGDGDGELNERQKRLGKADAKHFMRAGKIFARRAAKGAAAGARKTRDKLADMNTSRNMGATNTVLTGVAVGALASNTVREVWPGRKGQNIGRGDELSQAEIEQRRKAARSAAAKRRSRKAE